MDPMASYKALRPELFAASRGAEDAAKGLATLGKLVGEQFALQLTKWSGAPMSLSMATANQRLHALLEKLATTGLTALAEASDGSERLLVAMDRRALEHFVVQLFGGETTSAGTSAARQVGKIERALATNILEALTRAVGQVFAGTKINLFEFSGLADKVDAAGLGDMANPIQFNVSDTDDGGAFYLALPRAAVELFNTSQLAVAQAAKAVPDSIWQARMLERVNAVDISIQAILDGPILPIERIIRLRPGQLISLNAGLDSLVRIEHKGAPICFARLGQTDGALSLSIETTYSAVQNAE
jgi:flagellar motor switch protein FliM